MKGLRRCSAFSGWLGDSSPRKKTLAHIDHRRSACIYIDPHASTDGDGKQRGRIRVQLLSPPSSETTL